MRNPSRHTLEAFFFKPTADGFVWQAPHRWLFGKTHHYLVDGAQKEAILDILAPDRTCGRRFAIIAAGGLVFGASIVVVGTIMQITYGGKPTTVGAILVAAALTLIPLLLVFLATMEGVTQVNLAKLAPLIARLRPTDEEITAADRRRGTAGTRGADHFINEANENGAALTPRARPRSLPPPGVIRC